jgi:hypothetical protein
MPPDHPVTKYLKENKDAIIDWINNQNVIEERVTDDAFQKLTLELARIYPYREERSPAAYDNAHRYLALAMMCALWCGHFSKARSNDLDLHFRSEYEELFRNNINETFNIEKRHAIDRP